MSNTHRTPGVDTKLGLPRYVHHESLDGAGAASLYGGDPNENDADHEATYMPDDVTRDRARRMHYAAFRAHAARTAKSTRRWMTRYFSLRDSIVLGNRKLIYRAVRRRMAQSNRADDLIGDCHIVLIHAVAAYNPWLGVRFSTYAFTCLIRALSRLSQRLATDWLSRAMTLDCLPDGGPPDREFAPSMAGMPRLDVYLREDHPLLTQREKAIIGRRFSLSDIVATPTLECVGRDLGLSKERVRQVQAGALTKLKRALT